MNTTTMGRTRPARSTWWKMVSEHRPTHRLRQLDAGYTLLWLSEDWIREDLEFLSRGQTGIDGIGVPAGMADQDPSSLKEFASIGLKALALPYPRGVDVGAVSDMSALEYLDVGEVRALDLRSNRLLRHVSLHYSEAMEMPDTWQELRTSTWRSCSPKNGDLGFLAGAGALERLEVVEGSLRSLNGLGRLPIQYLSLFSLSSLWSIQQLPMSLKELRIQKCARIHDFRPVEMCSELEVLVLADCAAVPSLRFLNGLPNVRRVVLRGTRVLDGDLRPLFGVDVVGLRDRPEYNLSDEELRRASRKR